MPPQMNGGLYPQGPLPLSFLFPLRLSTSGTLLTLVLLLPVFQRPDGEELVSRSLG